MDSLEQVDQQILALTQQLQLHHNDYCQTITSSNKITPQQKSIFMP
jgi:hypothetical protein